MEKNISNYIKLAYDSVLDWSYDRKLGIEFKKLNEIKLSSDEEKELVEAIDKFALARESVIRHIYNLDGENKGCESVKIAALMSGITPNRAIAMLSRLYDSISEFCQIPGGRLLWFFVRIVEDPQSDGKAIEVIQSIRAEYEAMINGDHTVMNEAIENFDLSNRLYRSLKLKGINTVGDFKDLIDCNKPGELWYSKMPKFGRAMASEAIKMIAIPCGLIDKVDALDYIM